MKQFSADYEKPVLALLRFISEQGLNIKVEGVPAAPLIWGMADPVPAFQLQETLCQYLIAGARLSLQLCSLNLIIGPFPNMTPH